MPKYMQAPALFTARLELRAHRAEDLDACVRLWTEPEVVRYTLGRPATREEVWTRLLRHPGHWALLGYGFWLVTERGTGRLVGEVGTAEFYREATSARPDLTGIPEAGWVLAPEWHGRGYAAEAVAAALAWRDEHVPSQRTFCLIQPDNAPSLKLAAKMGFVPAGRVGDGETAQPLLALLREH